MSTKKPDEEAIRALFEEAHEAQPAPAFQSLWPSEMDEAAEVPSSKPGPRWLLLSPRFAMAAATLIAALAVTLTLMWSLKSNDPGVTDLASVTTSWEGPLDFLLRTPGYDFLQTVPGSSTTLGADLSDIFTESLEEELP